MDRNIFGNDGNILSKYDSFRKKFTRYKNRLFPIKEELSKTNINEEEIKDKILDYSKQKKRRKKKNLYTCLTNEVFTNLELKSKQHEKIFNSFIDNNGELDIKKNMFEEIKNLDLSEKSKNDKKYPSSYFYEKKYIYNKIGKSLGFDENKVKLEGYEFVKNNIKENNQSKMDRYLVNKNIPEKENKNTKYKYNYCEENQNLIEKKLNIPEQFSENKNELSNMFNKTESKIEFINKGSIKDINISNIISDGYNMNNSALGRKTYTTRSKYYSNDSKIFDWGFSSNIPSSTIKTIIYLIFIRYK